MLLKNNSTHKVCKIGQSKVGYLRVTISRVSGEKKLVYMAQFAMTIEGLDSILEHFLQQTTLPAAKLTKRILVMGCNISDQENHQASRYEEIGVSEKKKATTNRIIEQD
jgi:hypothetical protein